MKKVLSFVLVLALVLSSFSMAFAANPTTTGLTDIDDAANRQAIEVNYNLGIVEGTPAGAFEPTKAVTRAEFAAMMVRAQNIPDSALTGYTTSSFKDTSGYSWAIKYLAFCESKGILVGDGYGNVMPGRTVTANEAVTMALRTIGYTNNSSQLVGSWPSNYVTMAQVEGLYDDVSATTALDKSNAAQIIYNLLTVGLVQVSTDGTTTYLGKTVKDTTADSGTRFEPTTLLTANHGAVSEDRVVRYDEESLINTLPYVGDYAAVYSDKDDGYIIAIGKIKSTELKGKFKTVPTSTTFNALGIDSILANSATEFKADGVTYTISDADDTVQFLNADEGSFTAQSMTGITNTTGAGFTDETFTINAKVTGKKLLVYSIEKWSPTEYAKVEASDLTDIAEAELLGSEFSTDKSDNIVLNSFELIGVTSLSDIKADHVVYVYEEGNDDGDIRRVAVGTEVVEGVIKSFNKDDEFVVDGKTYVNAVVFDEEVTAENVGDTLKLYLDAYGDVYTYDVVSGAGSAGDYGVITEGYNSGGYGKQISMMNADGADKIYTVTKDVKGDLTTTGAIVEGNLVAYSIDKNGQIDDLLYDTASTIINTAVKVNMKVGTSTAAYMPNSTTLKVGTVNFRVNKNVVVYTYDLDEQEYDVTTVAKIEKGTSGADANLTENYPLTFFVDKNSEVVAMVVDYNKAGSSKDDLYGFISDSTPATNDDGDKAYEITGVADGAKLSKYTSGRSGSETVDDDYLTEVQLYKIGTDSDGVITKLTLQIKDTVVLTTGAGVVAAATGGELVVSAKAGNIETSVDMYAIADNAQIYELTLNDAKTKVDKYTSRGSSATTVKEGYKVWIFETDDDSDGADIVVYLK